MHKKSQISKNSQNFRKNRLKNEKNTKFPCYYFSNGVAKVIFLEIRDQEDVNSLGMVLIRKSETKVGRGVGNHFPFYD
jgi:hypothetical protein